MVESNAGCGAHGFTQLVRHILERERETETERETERQREREREREREAS